MEVPDAFSVVEAGLFRARSLPEYTYPFLQTLALKTIIVFDSATPSRSLMEFARAHGVEVVHLVTESWRPMLDAQQQRLTADALSDALACVLDRRNYPVLVVGINLLTGVIRKLQNWTLSAVLNDYNTYWKVAGARSKAMGSVYLEFLEFSYSKEDYAAAKAAAAARDADGGADGDAGTRPFSTVCVCLPEPQYRPDWVRRFHIGSRGC